MEEINKNGVHFKNVPNKTAKGYNGLLTNVDNVANGKYSYDEESDPIICALDINWCGIEIDKDTTINTTDELISWIINKNNISSEQESVLNECKELLIIIKDYLLRNNYNNNTSFYWYCGGEDIDEKTRPGASSNWHLITGTPESIETGDLYNDTRVNWILAIPTTINLNNLSNGSDIVTDSYDIDILTLADGVEYKIFRQIEDSKRINLLFIK